MKVDDNIAIFREGKLFQYSESAELLFAPRNTFVESFQGEGRVLKHLNLVRVSDVISGEVGTVAANAPPKWHCQE